MPIARRKQKSQPNLKDRIVVTPGVCGGQPRIAGTRIPVAVLLDCRALGLTNRRILESYPALTTDDLAAAWAFADGPEANGHR